MADVTLDTKGLSCPLPVLKLKKAMGALPKGQTLAVLATDPGAVRDFEAFCRRPATRWCRGTSIKGSIRS